MDCVACGRRSSYNRAVVDTTTGREVGALCVRCETRQFGELVDHLVDDGDDTCTYCQRDGFWAFPLWVPSVREEDGCLVSYVDYDASSAALRLCDEHSALVAEHTPAVGSGQYEPTASKEAD